MWNATEGVVNSQVKPTDYSLYRARTMYAVSDGARFMYVVWQDSTDTILYARFDSYYFGVPDGPYTIKTATSLDGIALNAEGGWKTLYVSGHDASGASVTRRPNL
jgi:hypothetical protein